MRTMIGMVDEFHEAFGCARSEPLDDEHVSLLQVRADLIAEEAKEVHEAFRDIHRAIHLDELAGEHRAHLCKELADLLYVTLGAAVAFGLPVDEVFRRTHESNMSKLGDDGRPLYREDGKVLKGPNYQPPNLEDLFG